MVENPDVVVTKTEPEEPQKTFTQEEVDKIVQERLKRVRNDKYDEEYKNNLKAQLKAELEEEAKLTEQEKLAKREKEMQEAFKNERISLNKREAEILLKQAGFDDEDSSMYLEFVNEDKEESLGRIRRVCDSRKKSLENQRNKIIEELNANGGGDFKYGKNEATLLQKQYDKAKSMNDLATMSKVIRQAQLQKVQLKFN